MADKAQPVATPLATPEEVKSFRQQQVEEWGTWVAVQQILHNGVLAYNPGDPVPASNVSKHGYDSNGLVARVGSAPAREVVQAALANATAAAEDLGDPVTLGVPIDKQ
jgi:hypothetical protein